MKIKSLRIRNFQCYSDTGVIELDPGLNLVAGINNVGKSAFLKAASLRAAGNPHVSLASKPHRDDLPPANSEFDVVLGLTGEEFAREIRKQGGVYLPAPRDARQWDESELGPFLTQLLSRSDLEVHATLRAPDNTELTWVSVMPGALRAYPAHRDSNGQTAYIHVQTAQGDIKFRKGPLTRDSNDDSSKDLARSLSTNRIYRFDAERLNVHRANAGDVSELAPNAANLAQVLNHMKQSEVRWQRFVSLVRRVFPAIATVTVRPVASNEAEICISTIDPSLDRNDLLIPLNRCGTGLGQVLAMLYLLVTSPDTPRVLCVDEPNSFLHPGAARALMRIFREHSTHQYLIATHSPEVIAELGDSRLLRITQVDGASQIEQHTRGSIGAVRVALGEVGARLGDILGYERLLWVEGRSEVLALERVASQWFPDTSATLAFLPIRSTSDIGGDHAAEVLHVYENLSAAGAPLPPRVGFLLDRESRTEQAMTDLRRRSSNKMNFLRRKMFENYLLHPAAVVAQLAAAGEVVDSAAVDQWMRANGRQAKYEASMYEVGSTEWVEKVHADKLLSDMFEALSGARLIYRKTTHSPNLLVWLQEHAPSFVQELRETVTAGLGLGLSAIPLPGLSPA